MQTIILTDNRRLSSDYHSDKTVFAEKIDINHILNTEVYQTHISKTKFWVIRNNIPQQEQLVHEFCKNLCNRGSSTISFSFTVSQISNKNQIHPNQEKKLERSNLKKKISKVFLLEGLNSGQQYKFKANLKKSWSHLKSQKSTELQFMNLQIQKSIFNAFITKDSTSKKEGIVLKQLFKKDFEINCLNELNAIFLAQQGMYDYLQKDENTSGSQKKLLTSYVFVHNEVQIGLNIVGVGSRNYLQSMIRTQISQSFNSQFSSNKKENGLLSRKQSSESYEERLCSKLRQSPKQTYHKILLFLFTQNDINNEKYRSNSSSISQNKENFKDANKFVKALQDWKIKNNEINLTQKLSREYVLIKQDIQNEKLNFRNKLKIFEAIIGENINVQKLLNEEKQNDTTVNTNNANKETLNSLSGNSQAQNCNKQNKTQSKQQSISSLQNCRMQLSSNNEEFKRLKESFQTIKNIDIVISEQNKKIEQLKKYLKQISKQKNQSIYIQAKNLNQLKKQIQEIKNQIQHKQKQYSFKIQKLQQNFQNLTNRNSISPQAQKIFQDNQKFAQKFKSLQSKNKKETQNSDNQNNFEFNNFENNNENKRNFLIRKQSNTLHYNNYYFDQNDENNEFDLQADSKDEEITKQLKSKPNFESQILKSIFNSQIVKNQQILKKRQYLIQQQNETKNKMLQQSIQSQNHQDSLCKQKDFLWFLYQQFIKNKKLIEEIDSEINSYPKQKSLYTDFTKRNYHLRNQLPNQIVNNYRKSLEIQPQRRTIITASQLKNRKLFSPKISIHKQSNKHNNIGFNPLLQLQKFPLINLFMSQNEKMQESQKVQKDWATKQKNKCLRTQQTLRNLAINKSHSSFHLLNQKLRHNKKKITIQNMLLKV